MRHLTSCAFVLTLALAACAPDEADPTIDLLQEVEGSLQRVDPNDPDSPWQGEERMRLVTSDGDIVCEGDVELDGDSAESCEGCDVTLEVRRQIIRDLAVDCSEADAVVVTDTNRFISFVPTEMRGRFLGRGLVYHASSPDGPWRVLATGVSDGNRILYKRSQRASGEWTIQPPQTDWRPLRDEEEEWENTEQ